MIRDGNGRFRLPGDSGRSEDPEDVFPLRSEFCDYSGQRRWFIITMDRVELGYSLSATEEGIENEEGYHFREFDPNSPYLALGRLRGRIQRALATRHLEERAPGDFLPLHDTLRGRISCSSKEDEVAFVIDGKALTLTQFAKIVQMYEGWQFRLDFLDQAEEVR
jgi:hypothetical protein